MNNQLVASLADLFDRDLRKLESEIALYSTEGDLWRVEGQISNAAGNLALHLCGNLRHFIGAQIGHDGYIRNREAEFSARNISRDRILAEIRITQEAVRYGLEKLKDEDLGQPYALEVFGYPMTNGYFLNHLLGHLNYHLGQINYHRRILTSAS